jgi:dTDP-glucose 4,6-dehydratase
VERKPIPVYGAGVNMRDWLHVQDHARGIWSVLNAGRIGETYCIGGGNVISNMRLVEKLCDLYDSMYDTETESRDLITLVQDRKGHDMKYAVSYSKMRYELGWKPKRNFNDGLCETIEWYKKKFENED